MFVFCMKKKTIKLQVILIHAMRRDCLEMIRRLFRLGFIYNLYIFPPFKYSIVLTDVHSFKTIKTFDTHKKYEIENN